MATPEMADAMYRNAKLFTMHKNTKVSTFTATMEMADTMYKNTNVSTLTATLEMAYTMYKNTQKIIFLSVSRF